MIPLNHFFKHLFLLGICSLFVRADVLSFFDPSKASSFNTSFSYFLANDAISLKEFFGDWKSHYHPKTGENIALQDMSLQIGGSYYKGYYLGLFHRYDVMIKTNRDFTDLYYTIKNKKKFHHDRGYGLDLDIYGLRASGLRIARDMLLYHDSQARIMMGVGGEVFFGHDMQEGEIRGHGISTSEKSYHISASSRYNYTKNYLYDLDVSSANGLGYGLDFAISYENSVYGFVAKLIANDIASRVYWKDLPYSFVDIETKNKSTDADGYAKYAPSIHGLERYRDFKQKIEPRYQLKFSQKLFEKGMLSAGVSHAYAENFPFIRWDEVLDDAQKIGFSYESRFGSFGIDYRYKDFALGVMSDSLRDFSSFGLHAAWQVKF